MTDVRMLCRTLNNVDTVRQPKRGKYFGTRWKVAVDEEERRTGGDRLTVPVGTGRLCPPTVLQDILSAM
jgi:hypothetical protein